MRLLVLARRCLLDPSLGMHNPALLVEGSWPPGTPGWLHSSLDESIDGRFGWIDREAVRLSEQLAETVPPARTEPGLFDGISPAYLNALSLRYYLVKLLRVVAYFTEVRPLCAEDELELVVARRRDEDLADLFEELCRVSGAPLRVRWREQGQSASPTFPANGRWRRWIGRAAGLLERPVETSEHRTILCGNPRLLDPVCRELLARGCRVWWLYDRFALRCSLRWRAAGVGQLVCDSSEGHENQLSGCLPERLCCRGINLSPAVGRWLADRLQAHGRRQTRAVRQIEAHFSRVRPDTLVLDQDATPLARAAVAVARRAGAGSFVVQHGAPCVSFAFVPPVADRVLVWGWSSRRQMIEWGAPPERIVVTGSPQHDQQLARLARDVRQVRLDRLPAPSATSPSNDPEPDAPASLHRRQPAANRLLRFLLLMTVPPRDSRADAVTLHLTRDSYAEMLRMAFASTAKIPGASVMVKLHPRALTDPIARAAMAAFPALPAQVIRRGSFQRWLGEVDCVLSCFSSAGVEATLWGVPVIQLLPPGSGNVLPHDQWGLVGNARSEAELDRLLAKVLREGWTPGNLSDGQVFGRLDRPASARIADVILATEERAEQDISGQWPVVSVVGCTKYTK